RRHAKRRQIVRDEQDQIVRRGVFCGRCADSQCEQSCGELQQGAAHQDLLRGGALFGVVLSSGAVLTLANVAPKWDANVGVGLLGSACDSNVTGEESPTKVQIIVLAARLRPSFQAEPPS